MENIYIYTYIHLMASPVHELGSGTLLFFLQQWQVANLTVWFQYNVAVGPVERIFSQLEQWGSIIRRGSDKSKYNV